MDTLSIRTFVTVTDSGSFSKAADLLYLTQPAISKRIAALEEGLGSRLFDRIGRKIVLTEAGKELYPRAKRILLELDDSRRAIVNLSGNISGRLSFATSHHIGLHRLPPVLRQYSKAFSEVDLDIHFLDSETACSAVENGELEIAIVTMPTSAVDNLIVIPVWNDPLCVVVGNNHPILAVPDNTDNEISPADIAPYPAILPGANTFTREIIDAAFREFGISLTVKLATNYLETIKMLVSIGLGWSVLPKTMLGEQDLVLLQVKGIRPERSLGVVHHANRTLSNAATALITLLTS